MKDLEVKTMLTDGMYKAMLEVVEAKGLTQAGYVRHLILEDIVKSQDYVAQIQAATERAETGIKQTENGAVSGNFNRSGRK